MFYRGHVIACQDGTKSPCQLQMVKSIIHKLYYTRALLIQNFLIHTHTHKIALYLPLGRYLCRLLARDITTIVSS